MDTLSLVLLGVIALSSVAQAASLVAVFLEGRRIAGRMQGLEERMEREVRPTFQEASRLARRVAEVSDLTALQARRVSGVLDSAATQISRTGSVLSQTILPLAIRAATIVSILRAVLGVATRYR